MKYTVKCDKCEYKHVTKNPKMAMFLPIQHTALHDKDHSCKTTSEPEETDQ